MIIEKRDIFVSDLKGEKKYLNRIKSKKRTSLFDHIYNL